MGMMCVLVSTFLQIGTVVRMSGTRSIVLLYEIYSDVVMGVTSFSHFSWEVNSKIGGLFDTQKMFSNSAQNYLTLLQWNLYQMLNEVLSFQIFSGDTIAPFSSPQLTPMDVAMEYPPFTPYTLEIYFNNHGYTAYTLETKSYRFYSSERLVFKLKTKW